MKNKSSNRLKKLSEEQIQQVCKLYATGKWSHKRLAEKFRVTTHQIRKAVKGIIKPKPTALQRFDEKWTKDEDGCHIWIASTDEDGYGWFKLNGNSIRVHQAAYLLHKGEISKGLEVRHTCDNPACVNPDHLILGTHTQNNQDKIKRYRQPWQYPAADYLAMNAFSQMGLSLKQISNFYGIRKDTLKRRLDDISKTAEDPIEDKVFYYRDRTMYEEAQKDKDGDNLPIDIVIDRIIE
jgi:transposase